LSIPQQLLLWMSFWCTFGQASRQHYQGLWSPRHIVHWQVLFIFFKKKTKLQWAWYVDRDFTSS
jgi:hypothetical protein